MKRIDKKVRAVQGGMFLPNLAKMSAEKLKQTQNDPADGVYCLDGLEPCRSSIVVIRGCLRLSDADTQELDEFMADDNKVPPTPNRMCGFEKSRAEKREDGTWTLDGRVVEEWRLYKNRGGYPDGRVFKAFLKRKQATFGAAYDFGQENKCFLDESDGEWPQAVRACLAKTKQLLSSQEEAEDGVRNPAQFEAGSLSELYNGVHVNLYPSGDAGVQPHMDSEKDMVQGLPIFSYTLLSGDPQPRPFSIYARPDRRGEKPRKLYDVALRHGDLLVMQGEMQKCYLHGVEPARPASAFKGARRLNLTVRAFRKDSDSGSSSEAKRVRS